jgi:hypothetical protein
MTVQKGVLLIARKDSELEIKARSKPEVTLNGGQMIWLERTSDGVITNPGETRREPALW